MTPPRRSRPAWQAVATPDELRAMHDAPDIRIDRDDVGAEGERRNRTSRIRSDTRQRAQARIVARKFAIVFLTDDACEGVQPHRAREL